MCYNIILFDSEWLNMISEILDRIWHYAEEERIPLLERVFQTQAGGYGYGDQIAGVRTPILRNIAKEYNNISLSDLHILIQDELHEARFVALIILIYQFKKHTNDVFDFYLNHTQFINNWDLVDVSAHHIIGNFCRKLSDVSPIWDFARSNNLWENRMAVVSSWAFVKNGELELTLELSKYLANHKHHLIHKACGWMLREVGKKNEQCLIDFLQQYERYLPKITVSYAKERIKRTL